MDNLEFHDLVAEDIGLISDGAEETGVRHYLKVLDRLKASEPMLDPDKEHGQIFRYMQLANTAYSAQYIKTTYYEQ